MKMTFYLMEEWRRLCYFTSYLERLLVSVKTKFFCKENQVIEIIRFIATMELIVEPKSVFVLDCYMQLVICYMADQFRIRIRNMIGHSSGNMCNIGMG